MIRPLNVYEATNRRLKKIFDSFDYVYVCFSGGKDSGVLLNMCIEYIRKYAPHRKLGVFHMDYEAQYQFTTDYVQRTLSANSDILEVFHCCVPFRVVTCTSMFQSYWRPWEESKRELWVRDMPENCYTEKDFDFFNEDLWDYDFQLQFAIWIRKFKKCKKVCSLVGIRTQESFNRWRAIHSEKNINKLYDNRWTHRIDYNVYNAYPLYDWRTADVWIANGRFKWDYNRLYDLYYQAGIPLAKQRVASPFISEAIATLNAYRVIDPDTWGKMVSRVNGVNFAGIYGKSMAMGWRSIKCPEGFSWKDYMYFLLNTLPFNIRRNYLDKLHTSMKFWRERGGCLSEETIAKLKKAGINFTFGKTSGYHTEKRTVKMEYIDDIDIPEFKEIPSYKRMCVCILKNDHICKYMGFTMNKLEKDIRNNVMEKYKFLIDG